MDPLCGAFVACSIVMQTTPHIRPMPVKPPVQAVAINPIQPMDLCGAPVAFCRLLPPVEYDKPFPGTVTTITASSRDEVRFLCRNPNDRLGLACAKLRGDTCTIILAPTADIEAYGLTVRLVMRHEIGHCHNWPADHPGQRVATQGDR